jgi:hypothetical protein
MQIKLINPKTQSYLHPKHCSRKKVKGRYLGLIWDGWFQKTTFNRQGKNEGICSQKLNDYFPLIYPKIIDCHRSSQLSFPSTLGFAFSCFIDKIKFRLLTLNVVPALAPFDLTHGPWPSTWLKCVRCDLPVRYTGLSIYICLGGDRVDILACSFSVLNVYTTLHSSHLRMHAA